MDWLATDQGLLAVASMSLVGSGTQQAMADPVDAAVNAGVTVVVKRQQQFRQVAVNGVRPAVISMSLSRSGADPSYSTVIDAAVDREVVVVVACNFSPAFAENAIAVGSTTSLHAGRCRGAGGRQIEGVPVGLSGAPSGDSNVCETAATA